MTELEKMMPTRIGREIAQMLDKGFAPSEIDEKLGLMDGFSHNEIVQAWHMDKLSRVRPRNDTA